MSKLQAISPLANIKKAPNDVKLEDVEKATLDFARKVMTSDKLVSEGLKATYRHQDGKSRPYDIVTLKDGSHWVKGDKGLERLVGAHYLESQLIEEGVTSWKAVETRYSLSESCLASGNIRFKYIVSSCEEGSIFLLTSEDVTTVSKYEGDTKPNYKRFDILQDLSALLTMTKVRDVVGFKDMEYGSNLRVQDSGADISDKNPVTIIDTEYTSFGLKLGQKSPINLDLNNVEFTVALSDIFAPEGQLEDSDHITPAGESVGFELPE